MKLINPDKFPDTALSGETSSGEVTLDSRSGVIDVNNLGHLQEGLEITMNNSYIKADGCVLLITSESSNNTLPLIPIHIMIAHRIIENGVVKINLRIPVTADYGAMPPVITASVEPDTVKLHFLIIDL